MLFGMRACVCCLLALLSFAGNSVLSAEPASNAGAVTRFVNGQWFDGTGFIKTDFYVEGGVLTHHPSERSAYQTVDLHGGFVVPPYGDAHEHNFDGLRGLAEVTAKYLHDGIFYAQGMTDTTVGAAEAMSQHMVDTPSTVDVTYAHGGLTGVNGHPKEVYESLVNGFYYPATEAQRAIVLNGNQREGQAYWQIATPAELEAKWPAILAAKPDLIKVYLVDSEHFKPWNPNGPTPPADQLWKGIDPALVALIVTRAHAAGLKVAAHVDTAYDAHVAVSAGVDELGHLPGYGLNAKDDPAAVRLSDADIAVAAQRHLRVQATAGIYVDEHLLAADAEARRRSQIDNLRRLKAAGVVVLVGSDRYGSDSLHEADYLQSLGLWSNLEMLRMWAVETPQDIFPRRKIGELKPGFEASFLVLGADPLVKWADAHAILDRWKQGVHVTTDAAAKPL